MAQTKCAEGEQLRIKPILQTVSSRLGNTPAILQKSYVHPALIDLYTGCLLNKEWQSEIPAPAGMKKKRGPAFTVAGAVLCVKLATAFQYIYIP